MAFKIVIFVAYCFILKGAFSVTNEYYTVNPELALEMGEDELEDFWDAYLAQMEPIWAEQTDIEDGNRNTGCSMAINGDLGDPQPVFLRGGAYLQPTRNTGRIDINSGESITIACSGTGRTVQHPLAINNLQVVTVSCINDVLFSNSQFLSSAGRFGLFTCSSHAFHEARRTTRTCFGGNFLIEIGFTVQNTFFPLYHSCFDQNRLEVLYTVYDQLTTNAVHQSGVTRPSFLPGAFFSGVPVNNLYTQVTQRNTIASIVGQELANQYITSTQFLARGHLAAMTDFVFATGQRASFYFINVAPQFQPFNGGNWMWLEARLRTRIGAAGYNTIMYTGTFGVSQLRDQAGVLRDIYLLDNRQIPVPLYYYKVAFDESRSIATAFIGINNPYYTLQEIQRDLVFCQDRCRGNSAFSWLTWQPDNIAFGYSFCCTLEDFRRTVPHLPAFTARNGCSLAVNGDLGQPQPIYLKDKAYLEPSDNSGYIHLNQGDEVRLACVGPNRVILHPLLLESLGELRVTCVKDNLFSNPTYLYGNATFHEFVCNDFAFHNSRATWRRCHGGNTVIEVGHIVSSSMYPVYTSCFDERRLEVLYVEYKLGPQNMVFQDRVERGRFLQGNHYRNLRVNQLYNVNVHKATMSELIGEGLTNQYIHGEQMLTRGHLAAKTDFVLATMQRSTFNFVNAAPQFYFFNSGNWNSLEVSLRQHIGVSGYNTKIYTGTFGVTQLRDERGILTNIYLHKGLIPVPLYYYKVVHEQDRNLAIAFVGINNPYYTDDETRGLVFCNDLCRGNRDFWWLDWRPDDKLLGYSFCCTLEEFRRTVDHLPPFEVNGLLT